MNEPHHKLKQVEGSFADHDDLTVEDAIRVQVGAALKGFLAQFRADGRAGIFRSLRGVARVNFTGGVGGVFVLDMRLLPTAEVADDELVRSVEAHVAELVVEDPLASRGGGDAVCHWPACRIPGPHLHCRECASTEHDVAHCDKLG
jgi:hypothetical protein